MNINIDVAIFVGFLILNLIVGLTYGRGVKNIKDYALGGRNFSTAALVSTIVATWVSGSGFFIVISKTYSDGLSFVIMSTSMALALLVIGVVFVPRMKVFMGMTSIAEAMGNLYGKEVRIITAITGTIGAIGGIAVQFKVFGDILNYSLGISSTFAILIAAVIIIIYSAFGGIRAVTYTDMLQFFTFGFIIPLVGIIIWSSLDNSGINFVEGFSNPMFNYHEVIKIGNPDFWQMVVLILYFAVPQMGQDTFQRISIGRNIQQVRKAFIISALLFVIINLATAWIPFLIFNINPEIEPNKLLIYIIDTYTYTGLKGLIIIGILSMSMSTADSDMNASSVLFSNDFCKVLNIGTNKELLLSRIFSLVLGLFAIFLALSERDLLSIVLVANSFYMPMVTVPFTLLILGFHSTRKSVLIGMGAGLITVILWYVLEIELDCIIFGMLANLVFLIGSHYLLKQSGGWTSSKNTSSLNNENFKKVSKLNEIFNSIRNFSILKFCKETAPKSELMYTGLGVYCIFYTLTTMYSTNVKLSAGNNNIILIIYQIMICTGTVLAMYPIWPARIKKEIIVQIAWNLIIFYMLIFFSCFFVMVSNFGQLQFIAFTLNIVTTAILVGWRLGLVMTVTGFYLSTQLYKYYAEIDSLDIAVGSPQFVFMYSLMLVGSALVIFLKPKQDYQQLTEEKNEHLNDRITSQEKQLREAQGLKAEFIRNVNHEYHAPMTGITSLAETLSEHYDKLTEEQRRNVVGDILKSSRRLDAFDANLSTLSKLSRAGYALNVEMINLSELMAERIKTCRKLYEEDKESREFIIDIQNDIIIKGDKNYLIQMLDNLIINAINYCKEGKILIKFKQLAAKVHFDISDEGIGIPSDELISIFDEFVVSSKTHTLAGGRGLGLALCKKVIEVHGGKITAESNGKKGASFKVILPI